MIQDQLNLRQCIVHVTRGDNFAMVIQVSKMNLILNNAYLIWNTDRSIKKRSIKNRNGERPLGHKGAINPKKL